MVEQIVEIKKSEEECERCGGRQSLDGIEMCKSCEKEYATWVDTVINSRHGEIYAIVVDADGYVSEVPLNSIKVTEEPDGCDDDTDSRSEKALCVVYLACAFNAILFIIQAFVH